MENDFLKKDIRYIKGVGEKRAALYQKLGISTVGQLLRHYPRGYLDMSVNELWFEQPLGSSVAVRAVVDRKTAPARITGGKTLCRVFASDEAGRALEISYFNNPYAPQKLFVGQEYIFYGKIQGDLIHRRMINPVTVTESEAQGLAPQYPLTEGLSSRMVATNVLQLLKDSAFHIDETLPDEILNKYGLMDIETAVRTIHFPENLTEAGEAKKRLVFEELLLLSLGLGLRKSGNRGDEAEPFMYTKTAKFCEELPFELTGAQKRCIAEIAGDLSKRQPMNRLLQGDVGSGKTVVAAAAVYLAAKSGFQSAVMAPTEVLAAQHAETFRSFLEPFGITVGLLTGSVKGKPRQQLLKQIANGNAQLIVGTHALISQDVQYKKLGLVITDEQHRFGVSQRAALSHKGKKPHTLVMSATPIPRTLSLILYGDLDISVLDELPAGRRPIKTLLVDDSYRQRYLEFVRKTVQAGQQVYIVCPLVEDSDALEGTMSAAEYYQNLTEYWLPELSITLMHGRMTSAEKSQIMERFRDGEIQVLVSTTVIEVGVDCPNATLMIIENAERFGLATLHQLRGRVGRGGLQSWCVLVSSDDSYNVRHRLDLLCRTDDGFEIAREDLAMRGPGDFIGSRQHGLPNFAVANLADDERTLQQASECAKDLLSQDPDLSAHPQLLDSVGELFSQNSATLN